MNLSLFTTKCKDRRPALEVCVRKQGLPEDFKDFDEYLMHVDNLMFDSATDEVYLTDSEDNKVAYVSMCISEDIHRKGDILDVTGIVIMKDSQAGAVMRHLEAVARCSGCEWISIAKHIEGGTLNRFWRVR